MNINVEKYYVVLKSNNTTEQGSELLLAVNYSFICDSQLLN